MLTKCKDCIHSRKNTVYPLSNKKYCNKWYKEVDPDQEPCDYAKNYLKVKDKLMLGKKLLDCSIKEISELCGKYDKYCKDINGDFCPLMESGEPFNECILINSVIPKRWQDFADKEV